MIFVFNMKQSFKLYTEMKIVSLNFLFIVLIVSMIAISSNSKLVNVQVTNLNEQWTVQVIDTPAQGNHLKGFSQKTKIPTTIHLDLLKNKKIQDPFYRNNYLGMQWVSLLKVKYTKQFTVQNAALKRAAELVFHGIDTYSTVILNGEQILKTNNSFVRYTVRVEKLLKQSNKLQILIQSAETYDNAGQSKNPMPFKYAHTRKACYQYSWDWAPLLVTMGIWKDVQIQFFDEVKIDYVWARNKIVSNQKAVVNFATKLQLNTFKNQPLKSGYKAVITEKSLTQKLQIQITEQTFYGDFQIQNPKLWWPNGFGTPHIYQFEVTIYFKTKLIDKKTVVFGIRTVELDLQNKQFTVKINGYNIYCKGANYVPMDMQYPRIYNTDHHTKDKTYTLNKLFDDIVSSNFNMIRVWGGGQYQSDQFLELASRKGIMLFYDFMFSDSIYPSDNNFLRNVEEQIKQQIRRTRNYPALALWSGNNQILQGVQDWGWGSANYVTDYKKLFEDLIRKIVTIQSPDISYIPSSPVYGVGNYGFERGGDFHYWGVWAGGAGFESYQSAVGPFNSQFGTQALPVWQTIKQFTKQEDRSYSSPHLLAHERHNSQFTTLRSYMQRYMKASINFESEVYLSGLVQAFGIQIAIRAQRTSKPKSYGTLYWQLNDAWPAISWSAIDYYGRWKPLQYMAKRTYANLAVFSLKNGSVMAINDNFQKKEVVVKLFVVQFDGKVLLADEKNLTLDEDSVKQIFTVNPQTVSQKQKKVVVYTEIYHKNELKMWDTKYYTLTKDLQLGQTEIQIKIQNKKLTIESKNLVKNLYINHKQNYIQLSDNYFDIVPGHPRQVIILADLTEEQIKSYFEYVSVRQAITKDAKVKVTYK